MAERLACGIMAVSAFTSAGNRGHLVGDVPALLVVAAMLAFLTPRRPKADPPIPHS